MTMKASRAALKKPAEEECGIWLDTAQLKMKAKQKQRARPISKLLNPFLKGEGYSVNVALSFTQTKIEMPKTKQSTISTFFSPQRKVLKNISTSDEPTAALTSSLLPVLTECAFLGNPETKPRREATQEPGVQCEQDRKNICEAVVWEELTGNPSSLQRKHRHEEPEVCAPQRKRRCIPASLLHGDTHHSLEAWSQDPLFSYSQCTEDTVDLGDNDIGRTRNLSDNQLSQSDRLQSERAFGPHLAAAETTSTHNPLKQTSSVPDSEKENGGCSLYLSPKKHLVHSYIDHLRHEVRQQDHADRENNSDSQFEWTKPRTSPLRKPKLPHKTDDDDSLSMLFTQDSEGLRVIAHRSWQVRSPLKDHSNMTRATRSVSSSSKALVAEKEEEDDMLFTQDSQGNLVIKH